MVAKEYPEWMKTTLVLVKSFVENYNKTNNTEKQWPEEKEIMKAVSTNDSLKKNMKNVMPFIGTVKEEFLVRGYSALDLSLSFDEKQILEDHLDLFKRSLDIENIEISYDETSAKSRPGNPYTVFS